VCGSYRSSSKFPLLALDALPHAMRRPACTLFAHRLGATIAPTAALGARHRARCVPWSCHSLLLIALRVARALSARTRRLPGEPGKRLFLRITADAVSLAATREVALHGERRSCHPCLECPSSALSDALVVVTGARVQHRALRALNGLGARDFLCRFRQRRTSRRLRLHRTPRVRCVSFISGT